ncbi:hypothetical protein BDV98DRAFT_505399 [Pterulicium gracile]|uniref:Uncharacterized protein n=1 Tax=Pterulicium gracile TaxID=1884261 RepID=A0A5C3QLC5_9AGAR|nr:hypothetical protein BDV98DRAFT_505399 [Pterula gracilis]
MLDIPVTTGNIEFAAGNRVFNTWYRIVGDLKTSKKRPIVMLHGGPGYNHT